MRMGMKAFAVVALAAIFIPTAFAKWKLDPQVTDTSSGYRCTPRWARTISGGLTLCNGRRVVFRTPITDDTQDVAIERFKVFIPSARATLDYRIHTEWNYNGTLGYTTDRIRFITVDGGRHWTPVTLVRQGDHRALAVVGIAPVPTAKLPVRPCIWRNYARPWPHKATSSSLGNECIPRSTARTFQL